MTQNPNWPYIDDAWSPQTGPNATMPAPYWVSLKSRTESNASITGGRQYELDQQQTGEATNIVRNDDGAYDPQNTTSPYWPAVQLYRSVRKRAQLPVTANRLTADQASAGAASGLAAGVLPSWVAAGGIYALTTTAAHAYSTALPAAPVNGTVLTVMTGWTVEPSVPFSLSALVGATTSTSLKLQLAWIDVAGAVISTVTGAPTAVTGAVTISVSGTPPANVAGAEARLVLNSSPAGTCTVSSKQWQVEQAAASTAYAQPGTWYDMSTKYALEWPQDWAEGGTYGTTDLRSVDAFGYLSQRKLLSPAYMELLQLGPNFLYPLDEPSDATVFADLSANRGQAQLRSVYGGATVTTGNTLQSTAAATASGYLPLGTGGPVVTMANPAAIGSPTEFIDLGPTYPTTTVGPPTSGGWTRFFAIRASTAPPAFGTIWASQIVTTAGLQGIALAVLNTGILLLDIIVNGVDLTAGGLSFGTTILDGGWHLITLSMAADYHSCGCYIDGTLKATAASGSTMSPALTGAYEYLGVDRSPTGQNDYYAGYTGDLALVAELPYPITGTQLGLVYSTFRYGGSGLGTATSATRYADILRWAGWKGAQAQDSWPSGQTVRYGPAVELLAAANAAGTDAVSALQTVVDTEGGAHYVDTAGTVTLRGRRDRYNRVTPVVVFGERTDLGEIPYTAAKFAFDPARLANDAAITQKSTGITYRVIDAPSIADKGDVQLQRTVNSLDPYELVDAGTYLVDRYRTPAQRVESISVSPATFTLAGAPSPNAWTALLPLRFGSRVRVMRRPPNAPAITYDGFVEQINWRMDDQNTAVCDLQISSAAGLGAGGLLQFWAVGSTRMTLKNAVLLGDGTAVVNPLSDSATNPFQANVTADPALYAWVIDYGTATAEYVSFSSVPITSTGYLSATVGIAGTVDIATGIANVGFSYPHPIGSVLADIGGAKSRETVAQITAGIIPANALDQFCTVGVSTYVGY